MDRSRKNARRIYIRHADKEYSNGDADMFVHDPGITEKGGEKSKMVAVHLIEQWGIPNRIIVSPYRRTRETAKIMRSVIGKKIPIHVDRELSEYLGNHRGIPIDVTESTLAHDPPHPETFEDLTNRVKSHHNKITKYTKKTSGVIWIITHGLIMKQVAALIGIKMPREFPSLTCLSIMDGDDTKYGNNNSNNNNSSNNKYSTTGEIITFHDGLTNNEISDGFDNNDVDNNDHNDQNSYEHNDDEINSIMENMNKLSM